MKIARERVLSSLRQYNPWWSGRAMPNLPKWRRAAFRQILPWMRDPPAPRAVLLSGARQVGKSTLAWQCIDALRADGVPPQNILYATLDDPVLKLAGIDAILSVWQDYEAPAEGTQYLFLDEIQFAKDWQTWLKLQVDFHKERRILVTGSAAPLVSESQESGTGRWHTIPLATLSFHEYLRIRDVPEFPIPSAPSLLGVFDWDPRDLTKVALEARGLVPHFHEYLTRGGFPQCARVENVDLAQRLLREDIVDKVLKRDMTAQFGVRRVLDLEKLFLYLCMHDGGILDMTALSSALELNKQTVGNFLNLLEATHLIHRVRPHGYGKEVLRGKYKVYLADGAIAPSVFQRGKDMLADPAELGRAVETSVFKHLGTRFYSRNPRFSYWRGKGDEEVDIVAEIGGRVVPFEVKYRERDTGPRHLAGLIQFCVGKRVAHGYVVTKDPADLKVVTPPSAPGLRLLKVPAPLFCHWLGESELRGSDGGA